MRSENWVKRNIRVKHKKLSEELFTKNIMPSLPHVIHVYHKSKGLLKLETSELFKLNTKGGGR